MNSDDFMTLAELGIALAGFSGIITVLIGQRSEVKTYQIEMGTTTILGNSFFVIALSLLPVALFKLGWTTSAMWAAASAVHVIYIVAVCWPLMYLFQKSNPDEAVPRTPLRFSIPIHALVVVIQTINSVGLIGPAGEGPYFVGVMIWLLLYFYVFVWLMQDMSGAINNYIRDRNLT